MNNEAVTNLNLPTKEKCDTFDIPFRVLRNASTLWRIPALLIRHTTLPDHTGEKKTVRHIQYVARLGLASRFDLTRAAVTYVSYLTLFPPANFALFRVFNPVQAGLCGQTAKGYSTSQVVS